MTTPRSIDFPLRLRALARKDPAVAAKALSLDRELQIIARRAHTAASERERKSLVQVGHVDVLLESREIDSEHFFF
jgi:hypothetical protein